MPQPPTTSTALSRRFFSVNYFYLLTEQGYLYHLYNPIPFIEKYQVPCGPAYLRNEKFLDFFFKNLHPTPPELPHAKLFPFVSRCGREGNFLAVPGVFAPVFFTDSIGGEEHQQQEQEPTEKLKNEKHSRTLKFGGSLTTELDPALLREYEGRLYHPVGGHARGLTKDAKPIPERRSKSKSNEKQEVHENESDDAASSATSSAKSSECVDPVQVEKVLTDFNDGKYKDSNSFYEQMVETKVTRDLGLVSSNVAFDIGFNFIKDDDDDTDDKDHSNKKPQYVISLDGGVTEIPVKSLW